MRGEWVRKGNEGGGEVNVKSKREEGREGEEVSGHDQEWSREGMMVERRVKAMEEKGRNGEEKKGEWMKCGRKRGKWVGGSRCRERKKKGREERRKVENMRWKKGGRG